MERVSFILSDTGTRISCLLNPEHIVQRRTAGLRRPWAGTGPVGAADASDDVLVHTGGGRTELDLDLLFDIELAARQQVTGAAPVSDVRELTRPLWDLAENRTDLRGQDRVRSIRFFWGSRWNVLCVVVAVAERLERFDASGNPGRSWLRLRLRRIPDPAEPPLDPAPATLPSPEDLGAYAPTAPAMTVHTVLGEAVDESGTMTGGERLDQLAAHFYPGRPWLWRLIAAANDLDGDPFAPAGAALVIPEPPPEVTP